MAEMDMPELSLMSLGDELTCSICLSPFDCPVTLPCGHNYCQDCLLASWKDSYSCPQCRTIFAIKPELKKNTVLSTVVETFKARSENSEASLSEEKSKAEKKDVIRCDACMEAEASQTCLTCMASFCEEHLRPHRDNPVFRLHQLSEPVGDLSVHICSDHHKLMEHFCSQHGRLICSLCLQQAHKGCSFISPEEQRSLKESDFRDKLGLLDGKIKRTDSVMFEINNAQSNLKEAANNRKTALTAVYQQIHDLLAQDEREAQQEVDREMESHQVKLQNFMKMLTQNNKKMREAREDINSLLSQSQTPAFLQASSELPKVVKFEPNVPRINLDSKKVMATQTFAAALKENLTEIFKQPVEARLPLLKPGKNAGEKAAPVSGPANTPNSGSQQKSETPKPQEQKSKPRSKSPGRPFIQPFPFSTCAPGWTPPWPRYPQGPPPGSFAEQQWPPGPPRFPRSHSPGPPPKTGQKKKHQKQQKKPPQSTEGKMDSKDQAGLMENPSGLSGKNEPRGRPPAPEHKKKPETSDIPPNITSAEERSQLLKYGTKVILDPLTAHKRIVLSELFTKATVSDERTNYPDCPQRFAVCCQVLACNGLSQGRHYWEVQMSNHTFTGIGLAYGSIDRKGPSGRLGRNNQSWCVEWFQDKLSSWHNSSETLLTSINPKRIGVLLDCNEGTATFYNVADKAYPFHTFLFPFAEAVYPAFWLFAKDSSVSVCKLQA